LQTQNQILQLVKYWAEECQQITELGADRKARYLQLREERQRHGLSVVAEIAGVDR
jgi:hypothetical protein